MISYKNILVIQTAFIGDAILASSLVEKLHAYFPQAAVSLLVRGGNESIYLAHPFLNEVLVWNKQKNKLGHLWQLLFQIRKNKYDCVINCHRYASSGFLTVFSGALHSAGYKQNPFSFLFNYSVKHRIGDGRHETERYNELIEDFTDATTLKPKLYPAAEDRNVVKSFQRQPYVCMAPASVWYTKQLPSEKWIELCGQIPKGTRIYLLGGSGDKLLCESIRNSTSNADIHVLAGQLTLLQSCALMEAAQMNYVNDSAPLHLASSVNAPVSAFFCSTVPAFGFGPLSDNSKTIGVEGLQCRPCGLHGYKACPLGHFKCGHHLSIEDLEARSKT